jgi:RimJ/RimL family protein N-acetyltransferase
MCMTPAQRWRATSIGSLEARPSRGRRSSANLRRTALEGEGDALVLAIVWREVGKVVGHVSLGWVSSDHQSGEIGFIVNPAYQGHGLAIEAAEVMLGLGFDGLRLHRIVGRCDGRNRSSARLMERLGMRREAHLVENEYVKGE